MIRTYQMHKVPVIIFAVNTQLDKSAELLYVQASLNGLVPVKQVQGFYDGKLEVSYVAAINGANPEQAALVWKLAEKNNQESILYVDCDRSAYLKSLEDGSFTKLGKLVCETASQAMDSGEPWTRDGNNFWVCR